MHDSRSAPAIQSYAFIATTLSVSAILSLIVWCRRGRRRVPGWFLIFDLVKQFAAIHGWWKAPSFWERLVQVLVHCCLPKNQHRYIVEHFTARKHGRAPCCRTVCAAAYVAYFVAVVECKHVAGFFVFHSSI